jgi:uncharacterized BrkB/YihY/UPF0761 family membrane protein
MPEDDTGTTGGDGPNPPLPDPEGVPATKRTLRQRTGALRTRAEATKHVLEARAGDLRERHDTVRLAFAAYERDRRHAGGLLAGGFAFRVFLWLLPVALVAVSVIRLVADVSSRSARELAESTGLGVALAATVAQGARASGGNAAWILILGIVLMLWAATAMVRALRLMAAVAWQIRPGPMKRPVRAALVASLAGVGFLALPVLIGPLYAGGLLGDLAASVLMVAALTAVFTWVMTKLPHPDGTSWHRLLPGSLLIAVGVEFVRIVSAVYFAPRLERTSDLYGALGLAAVFLAWLYLLGRLIVAGFALNSELWRSRQRGAERGGPEGPSEDPSAT